MGMPVIPNFNFITNDSYPVQIFPQNNFFNWNNLPWVNFDNSNSQGSFIQYFNSMISNSCVNQGQQQRQINLFPWMNFGNYNFQGFNFNSILENNNPFKLNSIWGNNNQFKFNTNNISFSKHVNTNNSSSAVSTSDKDGSLEELEKLGVKFSQKPKERWHKMNPELRSNFLKLAEYAKTKGITITVTSGLRTEAEQQDLVKQGRPAAKKGSRHLTGKAVDIAVSGNSEQNLAILGKYWQNDLGKRWGKVFRNPRPEAWHFDLG